MPENSHDHETSNPNLPDGMIRSFVDDELENLLNKEAKLASYEGGWGFFEENSITPDEFQITVDDDLLIDTILGEKPRPYDEQGPLSPERSTIAQDGVRRLFEAAWDFRSGTLSDVREARLRLHQLGQPERSEKKTELYQTGRFVRYQRGPLEGSRYEAFINGRGSDFLHFGVGETPASTPNDDKLETFMRIYVHATPEYAGHIAAEIIRRMRDNYGKEIYGKIWDTSTDVRPVALQRQDNLLLYLRTHSEMVAAAQVLRALVAERPQVFNADAGKIDRARRTDIPFVSIAEEPIQTGGYQESFNSSRENIEADAQGLITKKFSENYTHIPYTTFKDAFRYAYKNGLKSKRELKNIYRQSVQYIAPKYHVSQRNYALNEGHDART